MANKWATLDAMPPGSIIRPSDGGETEFPSTWLMLALKIGQNTWSITGHRYTVTTAQLSEFAGTWEFVRLSDKVSI